MAAGFSIAITGEDRNATKLLTRVQKMLNDAGKPAERLNKQTSKLAAVNMGTLAKGFGTVAQAGWSAARSITAAAEPLAVITSAASLAGLVKLTGAWSQFGVTTGNTAQRLDITTGSLQALEGAAKLTGATAGDMDAGLRGLQQTLYDATNGKNGQAVAYFQRLGIAYKDSTGHALKADDVFKRIATTIAGFKNPAAQASVANILLGGNAEALLPLIRKGGAGIGSLEDTARGFGQLSPGDIQNARDYAAAMAKLDLASDGLARTVGSVLGPALTPVITQVSEFIKDNQGEIKTTLQEAVKRISGDFKELGGDVKYVVDALGGWKNAIEDVLSLYLGGRFISALANARLLAAVVAGRSVAVAGGAAAAGGLGYFGASFVTAATLTTGGLINNAFSENTADKLAERGHRNRAARSGVYTSPVSSGRDSGVTRFFDKILQGLGIEGSDTPEIPKLPPGSGKEQVISWFKSRAGGSYTGAQSSGLFANFFSESGLDPFNNKGDHGHAYGIGQWQEPRQADFLKLFGHTMQSMRDRAVAMAEQLAFASYELAHKERAADIRLRATSTYYDAGAVGSRYYERPHAVDEAARNRGNLSASLEPPSLHHVRGDVGVKITVKADPGTSVTKQTSRSTGNARVAVAPPDSALYTGGLN